MKAPYAITKETTLSIADELKERFSDEKLFANRISIFLCGGASPEQDRLRKVIRRELLDIGSKSPYSYAVHFPEYLFHNLVHGHARKDLIYLEGLLATSVDVIVILLQSPGAIAELGAFASHEKLPKRLLVVVEPKHKTKNSFINLGPIRLLQPSYKHIIYQEMILSNVKNIAGKIAELSREVVKSCGVSSRKLDNPIAAHQFYLALIHVFEPIKRGNIKFIATKISSERERKHVETACETVLGSLIRDRLIIVTNDLVTLTSEGRNQILSSSMTKIRSYELDEYLTGLRVRYINVAYRFNKHQKILR